MPGPLTLRRAETHDAGAVAALHADSWRRHYRGAYSDEYLDADLDADRLAVWLLRLQHPGANEATVLAEAEGVVVGFVHVVRDHDPQWGSLIENLHVRHDRHRRGIGRRLMHAAATAEDSARDAPVHLWVLQQNSRAQSFYRALGGTCVEQALCRPPGGVADRLHGAPRRLRYAWHSAADIA